VVVRLDPFHLTAESNVKPVPLTVKVKAPEYRVRDVGLIEDMVGAGLFVVKVIEEEVPPPGLGL
jgi:hypothetical protein